MATHSSVLAWRIPGTGEPAGPPSMGSHRVGHYWSDLAAALYIQIHILFCWNVENCSHLSLSSQPIAVLSPLHQHNSSPHYFWIRSAFFWTLYKWNYPCSLLFGLLSFYIMIVIIYLYFIEFLFCGFNYWWIYFILCAVVDVQISSSNKLLQISLDMNTLAPVFGTYIHTLCKNIYIAYEYTHL